MHDQLTLQGAPYAPAGAALRSREDDGPVLRFGFTYEHVEALARRAVRDHIPSRGRDWEDRYEAAWGAAVEFLYSADGPVSALDLLQAASRGLSRLAKAFLRDRGYAWNRPGGGATAAPWFWRYWISPELAPPEQETVEQTALAQVMARLSPVQAEALHALAEHGSHQAAADALGVQLHTFDTRLSRARQRFLVLWHEHEAPSRKWRDRQEFRRELHGQPATRDEEIRALTAIAEAFGGRARAPGRELLTALAAADPGRYGDWDPVDLSRFLFRHRVSRRSVDLYDGPQRDGRGRSAKGYWLEEVTAALGRLTAGAVPVQQAAAAAA